MALISKATLQRNLGKTLVGFGYQLPGPLHALQYQILMRSRPAGFFERASKMTFRKPCNSSKVPKLDIVGEVRVDIFTYALKHSGGQATTSWRR